MSYSDLNATHNPAAGTIPPASWGDQIRDNFEFLIDPPACSVYRNGVQVVATSSAEILTADTESFDNDSMHSTSSATSRITAQTEGRYLIFGTVRFEADADGSRRVDVLKNGAGAKTVFNIPAGSAVSDVVITFSLSRILAVGDYVQVEVTHTAGNDIDVTLEEFGATFLTRA